MPPESPALTSLKEALVRFAFPASTVQTSGHIRSLHWYVACRLVIEGAIQRYHHALERLSDRDDLRDHPSRYEACGLTLVRSRGGPVECGVYAGYPVPGSLLNYNRMFQRLYSIYDRRFVYNAPALRSRTAREVWDEESPLLTDTISRQEAFAEMDPRFGEA